MSNVISIRVWKRRQAKRALERRIYAARLRRLGLTIEEENRRLSAWKGRS